MHRESPENFGIVIDAQIVCIPAIKVYNLYV